MHPAVARLRVTAADSPAGPDTLVPFVFQRAAIRGGVVRLEATRMAILASHAYPPAVAHALTELLAAVALLAASLEPDGSLVVQMRGDGPLRLLVVECDGGLNLRATAQWSEHAVAALRSGAGLAELAGGDERARLAITPEPRGGAALYQGIVKLEGDGVAASIEHYLATSEQLQSRLVIATGGDSVVGLLIQRLPSSTDADTATWAAAAARLGAADTARDLLAESTATHLLRALFSEPDLRVFAARPVRHRCRCSRESAERALRIAGAGEVEAALAADGEVAVTCEYCGRSFRFAPADARALFGPGAGLPH